MTRYRLEDRMDKEAPVRVSIGLAKYLEISEKTKQGLLVEALANRLGVPRNPRTESVLRVIAEILEDAVEARRIDPSERGKGWQHALGAVFEFKEDIETVEALGWRDAWWDSLYETQRDSALIQEMRNVDYSLSGTSDLKRAASLQAHTGSFLNRRLKALVGRGLRGLAELGAVELLRPR